MCSRPSAGETVSGGRLGKGRILGPPLSPSVLQGKASYLGITFPLPKGKDLNLICFLN